MGSSCKTLSATHRTSDHVGPVACESTLIRVWHVSAANTVLFIQPNYLPSASWLQRDRTQPSEEPHLLKARSLNIQDILLEYPAGTSQQRSLTGKHRAMYCCTEARCFISFASTSDMSTKSTRFVTPMTATCPGSRSFAVTVRR